MCDMDYEDACLQGIIITEQPPKVARWTSAYFRLMAAGFTIAEIIFPIKGVTFADTPEGTYKYLCPFTCVCGKTEWGIIKNPPVGKFIDVALLMENGGSVGIKHLHDDGYTPQQIREIRRAYL